MTAAQESKFAKRAIAARLVEARCRCGWSQYETARRLDWCRQTVSELEAGRRSLRAEEVRLFCVIYRVKIAWLLTGEGEPGA